MADCPHVRCRGEAQDGDLHRNDRMTRIFGHDMNCDVSSETIIDIDSHIHLDICPGIM
jgi:hypothetical protein